MKFLPFKFPENHIKQVQANFSFTNYDEFMFEGFKFYWNADKPNLAYLYIDSKTPWYQRGLISKEQAPQIKQVLAEFYKMIQNDLKVR